MHDTGVRLKHESLQHPNISASDCASCTRHLAHSKKIVDVSSGQILTGESLLALLCSIEARSKRAPNAMIGFYNLRSRSFHSSSTFPFSLSSHSIQQNHSCLSRALW
ncbi:hypothetical protein E1B28_000423 [Marasmius oreades]|uniref:Uncharacterized protein n=1 Tax=Marasmius oreades TaxID=181124 RepID=A0A9P7V1D3_9AGAR|nr:uncharacterized protein E1B28_000423 [Marasmius oreades]KAG7098478.1 hypothetical protein E1B28_000423 [Marasmius oreades]